MWAFLLAAVSCVPCHEALVSQFSKSPMGRSVSKPTAEIMLRQQGYHAPSRLSWLSNWHENRLEHTAGGVTYPMDVALGSGTEGKAYLQRAGEAVFLSPLAWLSRRRSWALTSDSFLRRGESCLACHEQATRCESCHGDAARHAAAPSRENIVNPARLAAPARDSVCEQCHLTGAARVANPGRKLADFRPGEPLENTYTVFVPAWTQEGSQAEQLAQSRCYQASAGRLTCTTCHDPHGAPPNYNARCQSCHAATPPHGEDCVRCHLPRTADYDGTHRVLADHRLARPNRKPPAKLIERGAGLRAWRPSPAPFADRNLGLANIATGRLNAGFELLSQLPAAPAPDPAVDTALGLVYLRSERPALAVAALERAAAAQPADARAQVQFAVALLALGARDRARAAALAAIALDPLFEDAYVLLGEIEPKRADAWLRQFGDRFRQAKKSNAP